MEKHLLVKVTENLIKNLTCFNNLPKPCNFFKSKHNDKVLFEEEEEKLCSVIMDRIIIKNLRKT